MCVQRGAGEVEGAEIEVLGGGLRGYIVDGVFLSRNRVMGRLLLMKGEDHDTDVLFVLDGFYGSIFC